jgi:4-hydroxy-tetrahydrodipicolinate synthase
MGADITVLSGDDSLTLPFMAVGAEGVISVASNLYAKKVTRMVSLALAGDFPAAGRLHRELYPMFRGIFMEPNPVPIKVALTDHGVIGSAEVRTPLCEMSAANLRALRELLAGIKV